jgi:hypothetical protein
MPAAIRSCGSLNRPPRDGQNQEPLWVRSKTLMVIDRLELCGSRASGEAYAGASPMATVAGTNPASHRRWRLGRGLEHHPGRRNAAER